MQHVIFCIIKHSIFAEEFQSLAAGVLNVFLFFLLQTGGNHVNHNPQTRE